MASSESVVESKQPQRDLEDLSKVFARAFNPVAGKLDVRRGEALVAMLNLTQAQSDLLRYVMHQHWTAQRTVQVASLLGKFAEHPTPDVAIFWFRTIETFFGSGFERKIDAIKRLNQLIPFEHIMHFEYLIRGASPTAGLMRRWDCKIQHWAMEQLTQAIPSGLVSPDALAKMINGVAYGVPRDDRYRIVSMVAGGCSPERIAGIASGLRKLPHQTAGSDENAWLIKVFEAMAIV